jgi:hypothetical protein
MEFCQEKMCRAFHPNSGKTKEQFMEENNVKLPLRQSSQSTQLAPLSDRNPQAIPTPAIYNSKKNTALCSFAKEKSKCKKVSCGFAHSLEDLVLQFPLEQGITLEQKREIAERITKKKIPDFFLRPSYMNSEHLMNMKKEMDNIDSLRQEESHEYEEDMNEEDEKNIEEFLQEEEQERAKKLFEDEADFIEMQLNGVDLSDSESEEEEDDSEEELKVKIKIHSISELVNWEKSKLNKKEDLWGDMNDE